MNIKGRLFRLIVIALVITTFTPVSLISTSAKAAVAESQMISPDEYPSTKREIDEARVKRALENKIVAEKLMSHGLSKEDVIKKLDSMSDQQVHQMASLSDRIPAGGDAGLGIVITILVVIALVLLIIFLFKRV